MEEKNMIKKYKDENIKKLLKHSDLSKKEKLLFLLKTKKHISLKKQMKVDQFFLIHKKNEENSTYLSFLCDSQTKEKQIQELRFLKRWLESIKEPVTFVSTMPKNLDIYQLFKDSVSKEFEITEIKNPWKKVFQDKESKQLLKSKIG